MLNAFIPQGDFGARRLAGTLLFLLVLQIRSVAAAYEVSNSFNARLLGGQYFFENEESKLNGNFAAQWVPAVSLNERWSLIPALSASWRGTKSVQDLVGGGTLFQQTQDHSANLKGVYHPNDAWQFKTGAGYRIQLLKETSDEKWGKGLFDFQKPSANIEAERIFSKESSARLGYDFYLIDFRNFSTLESQQRDLGRENASAKTLNTMNHGPYVSYAVPFPFFGGQKAKADLEYHYTLRDFDEQKIVLLTGDLSGTLRKDKSQIAKANFLLPFAMNESFKVLAELNNYYSDLSSDQNNFDARLTRFNPNYYSYKEFSTGTNLNFILGQTPWIFSSGFSYVRRMYSDRPVQDDSGTYGSDKIHTNEYYANFVVSYPLNKNFRVQAVSNFGWSRSNMKYEKTYRYNYEVFTYLFGVSYDY